MTPLSFYHLTPFYCVPHANLMIGEVFNISISTDHKKKTF